MKYLNKLREITVFKVAANELKQIVEKKAYYMLLIVMPMVLFFIITMVYEKKVVTQIPVAIVDLDHSMVSRLLIQQVASTRSMKIEKYLNSVDEIKEEMLKGNIHGAFVLPKDTEKDVKKGRPVYLAIYKNTSNLIIGNMLLRDAATIAKMSSAEILRRKLRLGGMSEEQAMNTLNPIRVTSNTLFNPGYNYLIYLIPGVLPALLQMIIMIVAALTFNQIQSEGKLLDLYKLANFNVFNIIFGKSIPHILINFATGLGLIGIVFVFAEVPIQGSFLFLCFIMLFFVAASFFMGLMLSVLFKDPFMSTEAVIMICTPAFIFSGYTFPLWAMTPIHQGLSFIFPYTHYMNATFKVNQFDAPLRYALPDVLYMAILTTAVILISAFFMQLKKKKLEKPAETGAII
jgi:ABC-2 type transport system permease protein